MNEREQQSKVRPPRWRPWERRAALTVVVLLGLWAALWAWRWHKTGTLLRQDVADLDRDEPGWRWRDLEAARADLPDEENSALRVLTAGKLLTAGWPKPEVPKFEDVPPNEQLDAETYALLRAELDRAAPALAEARKLADMPAGRYPITYGRNSLPTSLSHNEEVRAVQALLSYAVWADAQAGDVHAAVASCRALINTARAVGDEPCAHSQFRRLFEVSRAGDALTRALAQGEPGPDYLRESQELLEDEDRHPGWLLAVRAERALLHELLTGLEAGTTDLDIYGRLPWAQRCKMYLRDDFRTDHRRLFPWTARLLAIAQLSPHLRRRAMDQFDREMHGKPHRGRGGLGLMCMNGFCLAPAQCCVSELIVMEERFCAHQARLRCLIAALAAERYRRAHGRWPEDLERLTPEWLEAVPADPFDGRPLRSARLADGLVIYSVGYDGKDDGGRLAANWASGQDGDLGFRLWDLPHRRQPARPRPPAPEDQPEAR
jgi:hypothetical protein